MTITFDHKTAEVSDIYSFWFQKPAGFDYTTGQFITLHLPHADADERGQKHWFTLSAPPTSDLLRITTRFVGDKASTFKKQLYGLQPGHKLTIDPPEGDFVLPDDTQQPLIFVAGGIGITPFHSIIEYLHDTQQTRDITLLYAARTPKDFVFKDLFDRLDFVKSHYIVSQPDDSWHGPTGQLSAEVIQREVGLLQDKLVYISGPEPMIESLEKQLREVDLPSTHLKTDFFPGYKAF